MNIDQYSARHVDIDVTFAGVDITKNIRPYLKSATYTDSETDESDDLQLQLQDREGLWLEKWLEEAVRGAAAAKLKISAVFTPVNWGSENKPLKTGEFELDSVEASGPPGALTIKGSSLPYSAFARKTKNTKAWEKYHLSGIAKEIAKKSGLKCMYESAHDPYYDRTEQSKVSDIEFLQDLCQDAGLSLKCTDSTIVLFDQSVYEQKPSIMTIVRGDGSYSDYSLSAGSAETQYSACTVTYKDPKSGKKITGTAKAVDDDEDTGQTLYITAKVKNESEAKQLAEKRLRMYNIYNRTATFNMPGKTKLLAGCTITLKKFGGWDGKYMIKSATHEVGDSGYTTRIEIRRVLEGY